ncbi:hypothetical protein PALS2_115 [Staphylococcus phage PALS_2]|nr:hypothetical protein PALS2_115 [Staphylococcus phage PALS_2]
MKNNKPSLITWLLYYCDNDSINNAINSICIFIISTLIISYTILISMFSNFSLMSKLIIFLIVVLISIFVIKIKYDYFNFRDIYEYTDLNQCFKIEGEYYSKWYINLCNIKNYTMFIPRRSKGRNHWINSIESNRLLTYREFLRYKKNRLKIEKANQNIEEINEFQKYMEIKNKKREGNI